MGGWGVNGDGGISGNPPSPFTWWWKTAQFFPWKMWIIGESESVIGVIINM